MLSIEPHSLLFVLLVKHNSSTQAVPTQPRPLPVIYWSPGLLNSAAGRWKHGCVGHSWKVYNRRWSHCSLSSLPSQSNHSSRKKKQNKRNISQWTDAKKQLWLSQARLSSKVNPNLAPGCALKGTDDSYGREKTISWKSFLKPGRLFSLFSMHDWDYFFFSKR